MAVLTALGSALCYAVASVFQQHAAAQAPAEDAFRVNLLVRLLGRPIWLVGMLADLAGFVLQFIALGHGSLVLVQPLLVCGLLFALPLGAAFSHRRLLTASEWLASAVVVGGLALFLVDANPGSGVSTTSGPVWVILTVVTLGPGALLVGVARRSGGAMRATLTATAAGCIFGLSAALTKTVSGIVVDNDDGLGSLLVHIFTTWQTYGLMLTGIATLVLAQSAFQAGPLGWSLPALTVMDPVTSVIIGAFAFHESINSSPTAITLETLGMIMMAGGVAGLGRSPNVPQRLTATVPDHASQS